MGGGDGDKDQRREEEEGVNKEREHLLVLLPWNEPQEQLERIRRKHPTVRITYLQVPYRKDSYWDVERNVPARENHLRLFLDLSLSPPSFPPPFLFHCSSESIIGHIHPRTSIYPVQGLAECNVTRISISAFPIWSL